MSVPSNHEDGHDTSPSTAEVNVVEAQTDGERRRYVVTGLDGVRVAVVIDRSGEREVTLLTEDDDEPALTLAFTEVQACTLAAVLADTLHDRTEARQP